MIQQIRKIKLKEHSWNLRSSVTSWKELLTKVLLTSVLSPYIAVQWRDDLPNVRYNINAVKRNKQALYVLCLQKSKLKIS